MEALLELGRRAKAAARVLAVSGEEQRDTALSAIAAALTENMDRILTANARDVENAALGGSGRAFIDRLRLNEERIADIAQAVRQVVTLPSPVGVVAGGRTLRCGIQMTKLKVPFGVVGMIYEARPNVTVDAAALCMKSANVCLLRGSKEAIESNKVLAAVMRRAVEKEGLPADCILLVEDITRQSAQDMMHLRGYLDLLIPRGGAGLIRAVVDNATVPVIETGAGNCHTYVDRAADIDMAVRILNNAKTSRPSVCNACETVLVHESVAARFLPAAKTVLDRSGVQWRGCARACAILPDIQPATQEDYATEYDDFILAARVVDSMDEAINHIVRYTTGHSECIVTADYQAAMEFTTRIDAAAVYVNASTRFTDGGVFGLGAEIGISTQKLHTRGPMGLAELTTDKYILLGNGQVR